jgi:hypothetical protein
VCPRCSVTTGIFQFIELPEVIELAL